MIFTNTISLILALAPATLFAAPTQTIDSNIANIIARRHLPADVVKKLEDGVCDLSGAVMPIAPTPLPSPAAGLKLAHVAFGRGTQNYTCNPAFPSEKPVQVGAVAQLYNVTCQAVRAPAILAEIPSYAMTNGMPKEDVVKRLVSGHHEFTADGFPLFVLETSAHKYGSVSCKKNGTSDAPPPKKVTDAKNVPWLKLNAFEGDYKEVYRIHTAGGSAPATCEGQKAEFQKEYATLYYFWK